MSSQRFIFQSLTIWAALALSLELLAIKPVLASPAPVEAPQCDSFAAIDATPHSAGCFPGMKCDPGSIPLRWQT